MEDKAEHLRKEGRSLFQSERWAEAAGVYGQYIDFLLKEQGPSEQLVLGYSNRAETYLHLEMYADALEDTEKALDLNPLHLKTLFRKAKALLGLKLYQETVAVCQKFLRQDDLPADYRETVSDLLRQAKRKDKQTRLGQFEFRGLSYRHGEPGDTPSEFETFVGPVELKRTPEMDRGLFATRDLNPGEILFVAAPLTSVRHPKLPGSIVSSNLSLRVGASLVDRLVGSTCPYPRGPISQDTPPMRFFKPVNSIPSDLRQLSTEELQHPTFRTEFDEDTLFDIVRRRQVRHGTMNRMEEISGIYFLPALINHSCFPNVILTGFGPALVCRASREIKKEDQLFRSYNSVFYPLEDRNALLDGFRCRCERCAFDRLLLQEIPELRRLEFRCCRLFVDRLGESPRFHSEEERAEMRREFVQTTEALEELFRTEPKLQNLTAIQKDWIRASFVRMYWQLLEPAMALAPTASKEDHLHQLRLILEAARIMRSVDPASLEALEMLEKAHNQATMWKVQRRLFRCKEIDSLLKEFFGEVLDIELVLFGPQSESEIKSTMPQFLLHNFLYSVHI
ncbi:hypothetical protein R1sor_024585 [Riccia sorocarpa]|uniref:SET domain-containing protein n=1 Tax=Riccia sorocarpa TaxID=122646 RepID=A0ABD3GTD1_9MARC